MMATDQAPTFEYQVSEDGGRTYRTVASGLSADDVRTIRVRVESRNAVRGSQDATVYRVRREPGVVPEEVRRREYWADAYGEAREALRLSGVRSERRIDEEAKLYADRRTNDAFGD